MDNDGESGIEQMGDRTVYRTASGASVMALPFFVTAVLFVGFLIFMAARLLWPRPADIPVDNTTSELVVIFGTMLVLAFACLIPGLWHLFLAKNSKVMTSDSGLTVVNWRKARQSIHWANIMSLTQGTT